MSKIIRKAAIKIMELCSKIKYAEALEMLKTYKVKSLSVTKSTLKSKYGLKPKDIEKLHYIEVENPHFKNAGPMRLYLRDEAYRHSLRLKRKLKAKKNT